MRTFFTLGSIPKREVCHTIIDYNMGSYKRCPGIVKFHYVVYRSNSWSDFRRVTSCENCIDRLMHMEKIYTPLDEEVRISPKVCIYRSIEFSVPEAKEETRRQVWTQVYPKLSEPDLD